MKTPSQSKPKKNQIFTAKITDQNNLGNGICHHQDMAVFVPGAVIEDVAECKIIKVASSYAVARLEKLLTPSPYRIPASCPVFPRCGGCVYDNITYEKECSLKRDYVLGALRKAGLADVKVAPLLTNGKTQGYRNKVQYPVAEDGSLGYYARHSHDIIPHTACPLQSREMDPVLEVISLWAKKYAPGTLRHVYLRHGKESGELLVCLVTKGKALPHKEELITELTTRFPGIVSIQQNIQPEETNVILGQECILLFGKEVLEDRLCGLTFRLSPLSFYQVNHDMAELLYEKVFALANVQPSDTVADLFCGVGTIGLSLIARHPGAKLIGVEIIPEAVENAKENARQNGIENAEFYCGDANEPHLSQADIILIDPPRKGCTPALIQRICAIAPRQVIYVSCNPDTFARDLSLFRRGGYEIGEVTPVDLFPRTGHCETVALLSRQKVTEHIYIDVNIADLPKTTRTTATYPEIKAYIKDKYGLCVSSLNIAQTKEKHGFEKRENYNKGKDGHRVPKCPPEKEKAIEDAFKHFGML